MEMNNDGIMKTPGGSFFLFLFLALSSSSHFSRQFTSRLRCAMGSLDLWTWTCLFLLIPYEEGTYHCLAGSFVLSLLLTFLVIMSAP